MTKPLQELTSNEVASVSSVVAQKAASGDGVESWDVAVFSLASRAPIASSAHTLAGDEPAEYVEDLVDAVLSRAGLRRAGAWGFNQAATTWSARVETNKENS